MVSDLLGEEPRYTPRYVCALLAWAPADGALVASVRGGRHWLGWSPEVDVLASTWDLHSAVAAAQTGKKGRRKDPPTFPRPAAQPEPVDRPRRLADFNVRDFM